MTEAQQHCAMQKRHIMALLIKSLTLSHLSTELGELWKRIDMQRKSVNIDPKDIKPTWDFKCSSGHLQRFDFRYVGRQFSNVSASSWDGFAFSWSSPPCECENPRRRSEAKGWRGMETLTFRCQPDVRSLYMVRQQRAAIWSLTHQQADRLMSKQSQDKKHCSWVGLKKKFNKCLLCNNLL